MAAGKSVDRGQSSLGGRYSAQWLQVAPNDGVLADMWLSGGPIAMKRGQRGRLAAQV